MALEPERTVSLSGLTETEAKEFHGVFMASFVGFTLVAIVAHILVWLWRPWLPGEDGYSSLMDGVTNVASIASHLIG
ncbi:light-harvesting antenna LH1, beta subunit [Acuticoccus sp. MNP-M23]|uniref:light-harvesting antenna LH1, beta subunit n=1 Tax=Acuticoccus sp. MNP-M23 TaxID=3072793 RepID=UPI00281550D2|nr:light-harvesting antenna LH1, beta subunit [Acuticoccus sp. MNP-M23]WMS42141.1 light-harvesting antenna LH1, beta subunit [Acuticoccus sp. MNP-M23]